MLIFTPPPRFFLKASLLIAFLFTALVFYLIYDSSLWAGLTSRCWNDIDFKKTEKLLAESPIEKKIPFYKYYKNQKLSRGYTKEDIEKSRFYRKRKEKHYKDPIFVLFYSNGLKAVFRGYGSNRTDSMDSHITAYNISNFINLKIVPPVVRRFVNGKEGVVQLFIEHGDETVEYIKQLTPIQKTDFYTFGFLIGHTDFSKSNILISKNCLLPVLVDNNYFRIALNKEYGSVPFASYPSFSFRDKFLNRFDFESIPFEKTIILKDFSLESLQNTFVDLSLDEIKYMKRNYEDKGSIHYLRYKNQYYVKIKPRIYKYFIPPSKNIEDYSTETINKVRMINEDLLRDLAHGFLKKQNTFLEGFLYRKDLFLKAIEEYSKE